MAPDQTIPLANLPRNHPLKALKGLNKFQLILVCCRWYLGSLHGPYWRTGRPDSLPGGSRDFGRCPPSLAPLDAHAYGVVMAPSTPPCEYRPTG